MEQEKRKRPVWVWLIAVIGAVIGIVAVLSAFGDLHQASLLEKEENSLTSDYYVGTEKSGVYVMRFRDDNTVEIVNCGLGRDSDPRRKYYGTYERNGNSLIVTPTGGSSINCVIHDDYKKLEVGAYTYDRVKEEKISQKTLEQFEK